MIFETREDIEVFHKERIGSDPISSSYFEHYGIRALGAELGYKVDLTRDTILSQISEFYNPTSELILLSKMMYQDGFIRFQKPYKISAKIKASKDVVLKKNQEFTDGANVYISSEEYYFMKDTDTLIELELGQIEQISKRINTYDDYFKIPLELSYRDIYKIEVMRENDSLNFSQSFAIKKGDFSLEVRLDGSLEVVIRTNNVYGNNVKINDKLDIFIYTTKDSDDTPYSIEPIQDDNIEFLSSEIVKIGSHEKYMSIEQMQDTLKFNRDAMNLLVHNENYHDYLLANVDSIELLKVWQEYDELKENPASNTTNKIYLSYLSTGNVNLDQKITTIIQDAVYGKPVIIRTPKIIEVGISIVIESRSVVQLSILGKIKTILVGYYDDKNRRFSKDYIYRVIKDEVYTTKDIDVSIKLSDKGSFKNNAFYLVKEENINIESKRI